MENANLNQYCRTPLMVAGLAFGYIYAILPQADTLAVMPHLAALAYLYLYWQFHRSWSSGVALVAKLIACLSCGYATWAYFGVINGIDPGTTLLSAMVILKFTELKIFRDYFIILLINIYLLNTNFLYSYNYFLTLYVVIGNLMSYYLMVACSSGVRIEPALDAASNSIVNIARQLPTWISQNLARFKSSGQLRYAVGLTVWVMGVALPLAAVIFFAYPRVQLNIFNLQKSTARALTGFSPYMEPGRFSELVNDESVAFRAKFEGPRPRPDELYWRALTLEEYVDGRWNTMRTVRPFEIEHARVAGQNNVVEGAGGGNTAGLYEYELIVPDHRSSWLFSLDHPTRALDTSMPMLLDAKGQLSSILPPEQVISYKMQSQTRLLNSAGKGWEINLSLPNNEAPRARALAAQWTGTSRQKLDQAVEWLRSQDFAYSLTVEDMSENTIDRFLFEERKGFCEFFASSFAFLMRAAGVPARVVIGYQGGQYSEAGSTVRVYQYAAHAWVEVLLPASEGADSGSGKALYWHRIDPTVIAEPNRLFQSARELLGQGGDDVLDLVAIDAYNWSRWMRDFVFEVGFAWDRWVLSYSGDEQARLWESLYSNNRLWLNLLMILLATVLTTILVFRYGSRWLARSHDPLLRLLEEFRRRIKTLGVEIAPSHGCQTIANRAIGRIRNGSGPVGSKDGSSGSGGSREGSSGPSGSKDDSSGAAGDSRGTDKLIEAIGQFSSLWQQARYRRDFNATPANSANPVKSVDNGYAIDSRTLTQLRRSLAKIRHKR